VSCETAYALPLMMRRRLGEKAPWRRLKTMRLAHPSRRAEYAAPWDEERGRFPQGDNQSNVVSSVILVFNSFDTGQPALAMAASSSNFALSAPGIFAVR
jgi:hypothetical protein